MKENLKTATLAGGCFWCLEAVFDEVKGVEVRRIGIFWRAGRRPELSRCLHRPDRVMPKWCR